MFKINSVNAYSYICVDEISWIYSNEFTLSRENSVVFVCEI